MIRSARQIRTGFSLCVFFFFFYHFHVLSPFSIRSGIIDGSIPRNFARGAEAHPDDRATIRSFKTKNINKTRKRRERRIREGEEKRGEKMVDEKIKKEENEKKETEEIYSLERPCILRWLLWHSRYRRCSRSKWREETTREEQLKSFLFGVFSSPRKHS